MTLEQLLHLYLQYKVYSEIFGYIIAILATIIGLIIIRKNK